MIADEMLARIADRRMDDAFQGRELVAIGKDDCGKTLAVKRAGPDAAGKDLADFLDQPAETDRREDRGSLPLRSGGPRVHARPGRWQLIEPKW